MIQGEKALAVQTPGCYIGLNASSMTQHEGVTMKYSIIFGLLLAASMHAQAHAVGHGSSVGGATSGAAGGMRNGIGASLGSSGASHGAAGSGGRYSLVDEYQPWPQAEMQRFAKAKFAPYAGE